MIVSEMLKPQIDQIIDVIVKTISNSVPLKNNDSKVFARLKRYMIVPATVAVTMSKSRFAMLKSSPRRKEMIAPKLNPPPPAAFSMISPNGSLSKKVCCIVAMRFGAFTGVNCSKIISTFPEDCKEIITAQHIAMIIKAIVPRIMYRKKDIIILIRQPYLSIKSPYTKTGYLDYTIMV